LNFWQNDVKLFTHAIEVTPKDNCQGYLVLGNALVEAGKLDDAVRNYQTSLQIDPDELIHLEQAHYNLGCVLFQLKQYPAAEDQYRAALVQNDNNAEAHGGLGNSLSAQKKNAEAAAEYANALRLKPDDTTIRKALTLAMLKAESEKALTNYYQALKIKPTADAHIQIAAIQTIQGNYQDAVEHYAAALQLQPDAPDTLNNLAWLLVACPEASIRNGTQAVKYAERACELTHYGLTRAVGTLAAAYAEAGRFDEAIATAQKACALAEKNGEKELQQKNEELLKLYRAHKAFHEAGGPQ
jgi:tetratricopeptide (TPR) repeat protein